MRKANAAHPAQDVTRFAPASELDHSRHLGAGLAADRAEQLVADNVHRLRHDDRPIREQAPSLIAHRNNKARESTRAFFALD